MNHLHLFEQMNVAPVLSDGRGLKHGINWLIPRVQGVAPVLSDGRGLKPVSGP